MATKKMTQAEKYPDRATITLALSKEQKKKLKIYAFNENKTMAKVVQEWIDQYCGSEVTK